MNGRKGSHCFYILILINISNLTKKLKSLTSKKKVIYPLVRNKSQFRIFLRTNLDT